MPGNISADTSNGILGEISEESCEEILERVSEGTSGDIFWKKSTISETIFGRNS